MMYDNKSPEAKKNIQYLKGIIEGLNADFCEPGHFVIPSDVPKDNILQQDVEVTRANGDKEFKRIFLYTRCENLPYFEQEATTQKATYYILYYGELSLEELDCIFVSILGRRRQQYLTSKHGRVLINEDLFLSNCDRVEQLFFEALNKLMPPQEEDDTDAGIQKKLIRFADHLTKYKGKKVRIG